MTVAADKRARLKEWLASGEARLQPLTFPQRELWETSPVAVTEPAHHIKCIIEVKGLLTEREMGTAIQVVVDRQESLRVSFLPGKEGPLQLIRRTREANLEVRDLTQAENTPEGVEALATEIFETPFDLTAGPLYRAVDLRRAPDDHVIVFAIHHAVADGWTLGIFVTELFAAYFKTVMGSSEELPTLPQSYSAWGAAERAFWTPETLEKRAAFWRDHLSGATRIWTDQPIEGPLQRLRTTLSMETADRTRAFAKAQGTTLFSTLLSVFQIAIWRWAGEPQLTIGTPVANRGKKAVQGSMGYCSTIVPLNCRLDTDASFTRHLERMHEQTQLNFANTIPFVELVRMLGEPVAPGLNPLFDIRFALQNHPVPAVSLPTLSARLSMRSTGTPRCKLGCEITEIREGLEVVWLFREKMFSLTELETLDQTFRTLLDHALAAPNDAIADFPA